MATYRIGMVALGLLVLPAYTGATDVAAPVSNLSTTSALHSAPARSVKAPQPAADTGVKHAVFAREQASHDASEIANWVVDSGDNAGLPFVIIDKTDAKIFVFDSGGRIRGASPVLLGLARGDDTVPGIGDRELSDIRPEERTTPAGRFVAGRGMSTRGVDVVWVDYAAGVSMHRVIKANPRDRRLERLATPTPADNRITYGCINVPVAFYNEVVNPSFNGTNGIVYVLPETRSIRQVFGSYDIEERHHTAIQASPNSIIAGALSTKW